MSGTGMKQARTAASARRREVAKTWGRRGSEEATPSRALAASNAEGATKLMRAFRAVSGDRHRAFSGAWIGSARAGSTGVGRCRGGPARGRLRAGSVLARRV